MCKPVGDCYLKGSHPGKFSGSNFKFYLGSLLIHDINAPIISFSDDRQELANQTKTTCNNVNQTQVLKSMWNVDIQSFRMVV